MKIYLKNFFPNKICGKGVTKKELDNIHFDISSLVPKTKWNYILT